MSETPEIDQLVAAVVSHVLDKRVPELRDELVRAVLAEVAPILGRTAPEPVAAASDSGAVELLKAVTAIHAGSTQKEILRALLDHTARYTSRAALFVIKSGVAIGWQARGFANNDEIKDFHLDVNSGVAALALQSRKTFTGASSDMDSRFVTQFTAPENDQVLLLPLVLKDKVAALVYADEGVPTGNEMDAAALEVLVSATSAWLEVSSLRKQAPREAATDNESGDRFDIPPVSRGKSAFSDPFASHAPPHAGSDPFSSHAPMHATASAGGGFSSQALAAVSAEPYQEQAVAIADGPAEAAEPSSQMSAEDSDIHRKAHRFARLLMDEIRLYNQVKVTEGRTQHDLYDRLKDEIEKSRSTYNKRYGSTAASSADYFNSELIRSLAEDDISILGTNFKR